MTLGTEWATIDLVKSFIATPYPDDADITLALTAATEVVSAEVCAKFLDEDDDAYLDADDDTLPDSVLVQRAVAILAAQVLIAPKMSSGEGDMESETIGGYGYKTRTAIKSAATALRIDGVVKELLGGYLCGPSSGVYELETIKHRHVSNDDDLWWNY